MTKKAPRRKGTGGFYQRKDGMWVVAVELPNDGKARRRKVITRARKDDAKRALDKLRADLERAGDLDTRSPTLETWLNLWFDRHAAKRLKVSTRPTYRSKIDNYIIPSIGRVRLDQLAPKHVHRLHDYVETELGLSTTTSLQAHRILAKALKDAERQGRVSRNVATLVDAPAPALVNIGYLDNEQHKTMLRAAEHDPAETTRWLVGFQAGLRPGERLGLTRDSIDLERRVIIVAWQLQRLTYAHGCAGEGDKPTCGRKRGGNCPERRLDVPSDQEVRHLEGGLYLTRPKTKAGWRVVPMTPAVYEMLRFHLTTTPTGVHGLVFTRDDDERPHERPIDPSDDAKDWAAALERARLPHVRRHSARHTCNTVLDELGTPDNVKEQILGHTSQDANRIYTHVADVRMVAAMDALGAAMDYRELG